MTGRESGPLGAIAGALAWICLAACSAPATPPAPRAADLSSFRLVDLSHPYDETTLYWPTSPSRFESETLADGYTAEGFYYLAKRFSTPEHGGTHIDAPVHFDEGGWTLDEIPLARLIAPAVVIDASEAAARDPDYRLSQADVEAWEAEHGRIPAGSIVLLRTGWSRFWPDEAAYFGRPEGGEILDLHFPSYGAEAARFLIEQRRVALLGVDTASIDHGPSTDFPVHRIAGGANVSGLENLTGLDQLPPSGSLVIAAPIRTVGGSGAPVRAFALVPR
jgi:kynurenine formamidase